MFNFVQHRWINMNLIGRDYVVGDIHGEYGQLMDCLGEYQFHPLRDRLFAVGDLVDRGLRNQSVLQLLEKPWFFSVLGNHETLLVDGITDYVAAQMHEENGGRWFYQLDPAEKRHLADLIVRRCSYAITLDSAWGQLGIIHATAPSDWNHIQEVQLERDLLEEWVWDREDYRTARKQPELITPVRNVRMTVHGHVSCPAPVKVQNRCWIDTLKRTGRLTVLPIDELPEMAEHIV